MLVSLRIENFALIDQLELQFSSGLNVLTGETGAGKSIILDAIDAALGGKVNSRAVRTGEERALVEATFKIDANLTQWLATQQVEATDDVLICSREITAGSSSQRSRSRLNGVLVNKQQMETLRDRLVEITAQGQTVQIGQPGMQREWLDSFGGATLLQQREVVATAYAAYQQAHQALEKRRQSEQQRLQQLDLFDYQLRELNVANLDDPNELDQLEQERKRLSHSVELQQQSYRVYQALYQNESGEGVAACADLLGDAESTLSEMLEYDDQIQPILDLVSSALAQVEEAGRQINLYGEGLETDPERLQVVQERIVQLKQVCRKYGPALADAIALRDRLQADVEELTGGGQSLEELEQTFQQRQSELMQTCAKLTELRQNAAKELEARLVAELKPLAMEKVKFQVGFHACSPTATGADQITFLFSPNPGEPLQSLSEIASGGEMSRFLLALQACFSQVDSVGTLVFDEIDVGVSGRVAQAIAEKLLQLGQQHQVLCVTHQPIIAAMADHHFRVDKQVVESSSESSKEEGTKTKGRRQKAKVDADSNGHTATAPSSADSLRTVVRVTPLEIHQRREELAQLAGGRSAQEAIAFADSLLAQAANLRESQATSSPASTTLLEPEARSKPARTRTAKKA
jgi:DNA repair protein RecN (Recombination protein N)